MLCLTRKTDHALVALAFLSRRAGTDEPAASARQIADHYRLPMAQLMSVLKMLARARIVRSTRGVNGGYELAVDAEHLSLMEVITATEGPMRLAACTDTLPVIGQGCPIECGCPIRGPIRRLHGRLHQLLEQVTLADLVDDNDEVGVTVEHVGVWEGAEPNVKESMTWP